jgi:hypothetical protein
MGKLGIVGKVPVLRSALYYQISVGLKGCTPTRQLSSAPRAAHVTPSRQRKLPTANVTERLARLSLQRGASNFF